MAPYCINMCHSLGTDKVPLSQIQKHGLEEVGWGELGVELNRTADILVEIWPDHLNKS